MEACTALAAPDQERDWTSLPAGVLRSIFGAASTWQAPGPCLAAPVCSAWRSAAAGCRGICLLFQVGYPAVDESLCAWLLRNSQQLVSLVIISSTLADAVSLFEGSTDTQPIDQVLGALLEAAAAAVAAGRPLPLHTLRVLGPGPDMDLTGRLLVGLHNSRCLQLQTRLSLDVSTQSHGDVMRHMGPLKQATQLQELYLLDPFACFKWDPKVSKLLPASLKRLGLTNSAIHWAPPVPDLSHLSQLSFLHLDNWTGFISAQLPRELQQLQLVEVGVGPSQLQQEREILAGFGDLPDTDEELQELGSFTSLKSLSSVSASKLRRHSCAAAVAQLVHLSDLEVDGAGPNKAVTDLQPALSAACSLQGLRRLHLKMKYPSQRPDQLGALTQLTLLHVSCSEGEGGLGRLQGLQQWQQQGAAWAAEVGRMSWLRWLSVPAALLAADQGWLEGFQQLQVLVLSSTNRSTDVTQEVLAQVLQWLGECDLQQLPPRLLLLGLSAVAVLQAVPWNVRSCLQRRLSSRGCELVVGPDVDEVCDPMKQLAGLPEALKQALA